MSTKVMVFNFTTMQYEEATKELGKDLLGLVESMNDDCAKNHQIAVIEIDDSREILAVPGGKLQSAMYIETEAAAESWARDEGILTVYWHKGISCAFGYLGK